MAQIDPKKLKKKQSVNVSVSVTNEQWLFNCKTCYVCNNCAYILFFTDLRLSGCTSGFLSQLEMAATTSQNIFRSQTGVQL